MRKYLVLVLLAGTAQANTLYEIKAHVTEQGKEMTFPTFELQDDGRVASTEVEGCTYIATLNHYVQNTLTLSATMACRGEESITMPAFILNKNSDGASYELEDDGKVVWKYSVEVDAVD